MVYTITKEVERMEKYRAIPAGYMRVGEVAKKAGVTVRTLQYYDKEGLLTPSAESEGGFRLYTDKDMVRLFQILMMKQLGFGLNDIKKRLTSLDTPSDVVNVLTEHAAGIRREIALLSESLNEIEALKAEIAQMEAVDFKKFAAILASLQMKNEHYWMIKYFDDDIMKKFTEGMSREKAEEISRTVTGLFDKGAKLQRDGILPESKEGQMFAEEFWATMIALTGGDMDLIQKLGKIGEMADSPRENRSEKFLAVQNFLEAAVINYFNSQNEGSEGDS